MSEPSQDLTEIWVYLSQSPLLWLFVTIAAYSLSLALFRKMRFFPLLNPVLISMIVIVTLLNITGTGYDRYFEGAQFVHFMLGPATVALAVPLFRNFQKVRRALFPLLIALAGGSLTAALSAFYLADIFGASEQIALSFVPKSVTSPIAMGIAENLGGLPSLTTVLVILTGTLGATLGLPLMKAFALRDERACGFAMGLACHGIGTARAFQASAMTGTFAVVGMGSNGLFTAIMVPLIADTLL